MLNKFKDITKQQIRSLGYELCKVPVPGRFNKNYLYYKRLYDSIKNIEGDIVECGVGKGISFLTLVNLVKEEGLGRKIYGFDSFEGFPEPSQYDKSAVRNSRKGDWNYETIESIKNLSLLRGV